MSKKRLDIAKISDGVLAKTVDLVLVSIFYGLEFGFGGYGETYKAAENTTNDLSEINYQRLKRGIFYLKKKGFVQSVRESASLPTITATGKRRLEGIVPRYEEERVWDKRIYLVTYDLPTKQNRQRDRLRNFLKKIGCGLLQESVWLTPYNPKKLLEEFLAESKLESDLVIISSLGKDGTIGELDLIELMEKVYNLSEVNEKYKEFLEETAKGEVSRDKIIFSFLSILKGDPQIPFEILPKDWVGREAYKVFKKFAKS